MRNCSYSKKQVGRVLENNNAAKLNLETVNKSISSEK